MLNLAVYTFIHQLLEEQDFDNIYFSPFIVPTIFHNYILLNGLKQGIELKTTNRVATTQLIAWYPMQTNQSNPMQTNQTNPMQTNQTNPMQSNRNATSSDNLIMRWARGQIVEIYFQRAEQRHGTYIAIGWIKPEYELSISHWYHGRCGFYKRMRYARITGIYYKSLPTHTITAAYVLCGDRSFKWRQLIYRLNGAN